MALHEQSVGATDEWYTPPYVFAALGATFDLDVAHPGEPYADWIPAASRLTANSLETPWHGFVWMNPPFGGRNALVPWLRRFIEHGNGIALVPDRTSAPWWQDAVQHIDLALFVSPKIRFVGRSGIIGASPAQGTSLFAIGESGTAALNRAAANGLGALLRPASKNTGARGRLRAWWYGPERFKRAHVKIGEYGQLSRTSSDLLRDPLVQSQLKGAARGRVFRRED